MASIPLAMEISDVKNYLYIINLVLVIGVAVHHMSRPVSVFASVLVIGVAVHSYIVSRSQANRKAIETMNGRIDTQESRVQRIEAQLQSLPEIKRKYELCP